MKYEKPELVPLGSAVSAVQIMRKPDPGVKDTALHEGFTANAYEADE